jgi:P27 family predicted phage terminase small subunit
MPARREDPALKQGKAKGGILWLDAAAENAARLGIDALDWGTIPEELDEAARKKWQELQQRYSSNELRFHENDRDMLALFCATYSLRLMVLDALCDEGVMVEGRSSADAHRTVKSPLLAVVRDQTSLLIRLATELGMSPNAAAKAGLVNAKLGEEAAGYDPFSRR